MWDACVAQLLMAASEVAAAADGAAAGAGAGDAAAPTGMQSMFGNPIIMLVAFFAIMYLLILRPQQKQEKQRQQMLANLTRNDKVVTSGGIRGTIIAVRDKSVVLRVNDADNTTIEFVRSAISQVEARPGDDDGQDD